MSDGAAGRSLRQSCLMVLRVDDMGRRGCGWTWAGGRESYGSGFSGAGFREDESDGGEFEVVI